MSEVLFVGGNGIREREESLPSLVQRCLGPRLEGFPSARHCVVDIFLGGNGDLGIWLLGGRVDVVAGFGGGFQFVVDNVVKGLQVPSASKRYWSRMVALLTVKSNLGAWPSTPLARPLATV